VVRADGIRESGMTTEQDTEVVEEQELPEDMVSAWASVLLDVFEKLREEADADEPSTDSTPGSDVHA
jgi:hypothetical protein